MYLNIHSYYSLRYGTMDMEKLIEQALKNGVRVMALTDINNTMGTLDFVKICLENGIYPIAGIEFRNGDRYLYTGLARNNRGFQAMNEFLSLCNEKKEDLPVRAPKLDDVWFVYSWENRPENLRENELVGITPRDIKRLHSSPLRHAQHKLIVWQPVSFSHKMRK